MSPPSPPEDDQLRPSPTKAKQKQPITSTISQYQTGKMTDFFTTISRHRHYLSSLAPAIHNNQPLGAAIAMTTILAIDNHT